MVYGGISVALVNLLLWALGRRRLYRVAGNSMRPALLPDDLLFVEIGISHGSLQPGEVVIAQHPYQMEVVMVKRIAAVTRDGRIALRGDSPQQSSDSRQFGSLQASQILGRATCKIAATRNPLRVDKRDCLERSGG